MSRSETTYCLTTNQPTNQPLGVDVPEEYISLRITMPHEGFSALHDNVLHDLEWYISYPHTGQKRSNEHFHVFFPAGIAERIRKRIKSHYGAGNAVFSLKSFKNGVLSAIQYGSKEATKPFVFGPNTAEWILGAPPWEQRNVGVNTGINQRPLRNPDHFRQITYSNMERVCLRYRKDNGIQSIALEDTLTHMFEHDWRYQVTVLRNGIPSSYFDDFTAKCEGKTVFKQGRHLKMKIDEVWERDRRG